MDTNTGESPGHQSQSQKLGNSSSEEEMGHWTLTGVEPRDYDDDSASHSMSLSEMLPTTAIDAVSELTRRIAAGNCK